MQLWVHVLCIFVFWLFLPEIGCGRSFRGLIVLTQAADLRSCHCVTINKLFMFLMGCLHQHESIMYMTCCNLCGWVWTQSELVSAADDGQQWV